VRKAEDDHHAAIILAEEPDPLHDQVCFSCQQSAEKYLKALLQEAGLSIPKIHDCNRLLGLLPAKYSSLLRYRRGLILLSRYAVTARYPGANASKRQAASALRWAGKVRLVWRDLLGLETPPHEKESA
jgi:HEPN domain-containing protein